ncbi:TetR/AcrR family transcriptional regulator, partial [Pseudomonas aeruginosa]
PYNTALMSAALPDAEDLRERVLRLIRCALQSTLGGTGVASAVLVYEWRSLSAESQAYIIGLRHIYQPLWLDVLGDARLSGYCP